MIIFLDQKQLSLNLIIISVSLHHYVSTKIFVEYIFLEYLLVSFDLFWQQKKPLEGFCKKCVLKIFAYFTEKTPVLESFLNKVAGLKVCNFIRKETLPQLFSHEYCKNFKNSFWYGIPPVAAS